MLLFGADLVAVFGISFGVGVWHGLLWAICALAVFEIVITAAVRRWLHFSIKPH